jgi:hypothetical protein
MKKVFVIAVGLMVSMTSTTLFRTLNSTTYIEPGKSFVLGDNEHGAFRVKLTNVSPFEIYVYSKTLNGEKKLEKQVASKEKVELDAEKNSALIIQNPSTEKATVTLKVKGDIVLNMEYSDNR